MKVSVAFSAPAVPPDTGASSMSMPRSAARAGDGPRAVAGAMVEQVDGPWRTGSMTSSRRRPRRRGGVRVRSPGSMLTTISASATAARGRSRRGGPGGDTGRDQVRHQVVHGHLVTRGREVPRHRTAHVTDADESDSHVFVLPRSNRGLLSQGGSKCAEHVPVRAVAPPTRGAVLVHDQRAYPFREVAEPRAAARDRHLHAEAVREIQGRRPAQLLADGCRRWSGSPRASSRGRRAYQSPAPDSVSSAARALAASAGISGSAPAMAGSADSRLPGSRRGARLEGTIGVTVRGDQRSHGVALVAGEVRPEARVEGIGGSPSASR